MEKGFVILTEVELETLCGKFFDKGYYANLYRTETTDNSIDVYNSCKYDLLKNYIKQPTEIENITKK